MKIHSKAVKIAIFSVVFLFFVLPPLFNTAEGKVIFKSWTFPLNHLILSLLSAFLLYINDALTFHFNSLKNSISYKIIFPAVFSLCLLFCLAFLINGISILVKHNPIQNEIALPTDILSWTYFSLTFIFSAFYEEAIYRLYIPETLEDFFKLENKKIAKKCLNLIFEVATALLFGFSHGYAGVFSIINAICAHIILRLTYKKTRTIYASFIAHTIYNIIIFLIIAKV